MKREGGRKCGESQADSASPSKLFHPNLIAVPCNRIVALDGALDGRAVAHYHCGVLDGHGEGGRN